MGKKDKDEMSKQKRSFLDGAKKEELAQKKQMKFLIKFLHFAGYGFNKSHAAAYAIAYQTAWVKTNYIYEFFVSMMTVENNNTDKLSLFIEDAKKLGLKILQPCINKSSYEFLIENVSDGEFAIRYSLSSIKNVGTDAIKNIVHVREKDGEFKDIDDFLNKVPYKFITKKSLESLIKSGTFDCIEENRNKLYKSIELMLNYSHSIEKEKISYQSNLFNNNDVTKLLIDLKDTTDWSFQEKINNEFSSLGLYLSAHPLDGYSNILLKMNVTNSIEYLMNLQNIFKRI